MSNVIEVIFRGNADQVRGAVTGLKGSFTELSAKIDVVKQAAQTLSQAYQELVGNTIEYAGTVRQMMRVSGQNAEETSKLIQLTDDFGVELGTLQTAMRGAAIKGVAFTTENLARLSDEYLRLNPGVERSSFLIQTFGRAGLGMAAIMEKGADAIRRQSGEVEKNLILTQDNVDAARRWEINVDNVTDSYNGLKIALGNQIIPALNTAIETIGLLITMQEKLRGAWNTHNKEVFNTASTYNDYRAEMIRAAEAAGYIVRVSGDQVQVFRRVEGGYLALVDGMRVMTAQEFAARDSMMDHVRATQLVKEAQDQLGNSTAGVAEWAARYQGYADEVKVKTEEVAQSIREELSGAIDTATKAAEGWKKSAGDDVARQLEAAGINGNDLRNALGLLDRQFGTSFIQTRDMQDAVKKLVDEYKRTGDLDTFGRNLGNLKDRFLPLSEEVAKARTQVELLWSTLRALDGSSLSINVRYSEGKGSSAGGGPTGRRGEEGGDRAWGGPVSAGGYYTTGERGPEPFIPSRNGYVLSRSDARAALQGAPNINVTIIGGAGAVADGRMAAAAIARELRRERGI